MNWKIRLPPGSCFGSVDEGRLSYGNRYERVCVWMLVSLSVAWGW